MLIQLRDFSIAIASGALLTLMIKTNSLLAKFSTPIFASWVAHGVGACVAMLLIISFSILTKANKKNQHTDVKDQFPIWYYFGGIPGALTVVLAAIAVNNNLSLSGTISLMLAGQLLFSICVDHFGLLSVPMRKINIKDFFAVIFILIGSAMILFARNL